MQHDNFVGRYIFFHCPSGLSPSVHVHVYTCSPLELTSIYVPVLACYTVC